MKRQISILACVLMLLAIVFAVASCSQPEAAHVHEYAEFVSKEATCTEKGEVTLTCACGDKYTNETAAKGHNLAPIAAVEPTCTTEGKTEGVQCTDCGLITVAQSTIAPIGHKLGAAATCTTAQTCELCDHVFVEALGHNAPAPTCTEDSVCKRCGEKQADALGHEPANDATCTEASICGVCDEVVAEALGHTYPSDCYAGVCQVCWADDSYVEGNGAHEYDYLCSTMCNKCWDFTNMEAQCNMIEVEAKASTCTEHGNVKYSYCEYCGYCEDENGYFTNMMNVKLPLAEHEYLYECDHVCMNCMQETNTEAEHSITHVDAKAPTCTAIGNIEFWYCEFCGYCWADADLTRVTNMMSVKLPANGHSYEFDCDQYCEVCGELTREDAEHLPDHIDAVDPTCTKTGCIEHDVCEYCGMIWDADGKVVNTAVVPALGHKYEVACDPVCQVCSFVNTEATHNVVKVTKKAATCTADGAKIDYWTCSYCELCWVDEACTLNTNKANVVIPALGHKGHEEDFKCDTCNKVVRPATGTTLTITQANALAKAMGNTYTTEKYYVTGYVLSVDNTTYGNMYIKDEDGNKFYIYGLYTWNKATRYDKMSYKPVKGDELTVYTVLGCFNNSPQGKDAWVDEVVQHTTHNWTEASCLSPKTCTICEAVEGTTLPHNYVGGFCAVCGREEGLKEEWVLVTNVADLKAGDQIVIVAKNENYAMSTTQNTNNRGSVAITKTGDTVTINSSVQIITLEDTGNSSYKFYFGVGSSKYLYAASSSKNYLKSGTKGNNAMWSVSITSAGVATVKANYNGRNWMRFNTGNNPKLFSCYGSGQTDIAIYKLTVR